MSDQRALGNEEVRDEHAPTAADPPLRSRRRQVFVIAVLLFMLTFAKGFAWAAIIPPGQEPDEPAHARYVDATLHDEAAWKGSQDASRAPSLVLRASDFEQLRSSPHERRPFTRQAADRRAELVQRSQRERSRAATKTPFGERVGYPPLYYFIVGQVVSATRSTAYDLTWRLERLFSVSLASVTIVIQFLVLLSVFGGRIPAAGLASLTLTMLPMYSALESAINPEVLLVLWSSILLFVAMRLLKDPLCPRYHLIAGVTIAFGLLTKPSMLALVVPVLVAVLIGIKRSRRRHRLSSALRSASYLLLPSVFIYGAWRVAASTTGDVRLATHPPIRLSGDSFREFLHHLSLNGQRQFVDSFWGVFGWLDVFMPPRVYLVLMVFTIVALGAASVALLMRGATDQILVCVSGVASLTALIVFLEFSLFSYGGFAQGRYFFPMLVAMIAIHFWSMDFILSKRPILRAAYWVAAPVAALLLHVVALGTAIVPRYLL